MIDVTKGIRIRLASDDVPRTGEAPTLMAPDVVLDPLAQQAAIEAARLGLGAVTGRRVEAAE